MTHGLTPRQEEARGVVTNGVGNRTTAHLNLSRTMASFVAEEVERKARFIRKPPSPRIRIQGTPEGWPR